MRFRPANISLIIIATKRPRVVESSGKLSAGKLHAHCCAAATVFAMPCELAPPPPAQFPYYSHDTFLVSAPGGGAEYHL